MSYHRLFDTAENKALIAICTRKLISNIGIGAIVWGVVNSALGVAAMQASFLNVGLAILGIVMLGTGVRAIKSPSLGVLLMETMVSVLLFLWNLGVSILNYHAIGAFDPLELVFPLVIAVVFANYYRKLGHLREQIASVDPEKIKTTKKMCKALVKKKLKNEPSVIQTTDRKCRAQLMEGTAFFIQRDLMRAFVASKEDVSGGILKPDAKSLRLHLNHPVSKLRYQFDKKNSDKLKAWLSTGNGPTIESNATS